MRARFVNRRRFLAASAVALVAPGTADAQQPRGTNRIAIVNGAGRDSDTDPSPARHWVVHPRGSVAGDKSRPGLPDRAW